MITAVNPVQQSLTRIQTNQPAFKSTPEQKNGRMNVSFQHRDSSIWYGAGPWAIETGLWALLITGVAKSTSSDAVGIVGFVGAALIGLVNLIGSALEGIHNAGHAPRLSKMQKVKVLLALRAV